jgi:hypothetical protein
MPPRANMITVRIKRQLYRPEGDSLMARAYLANGEFDMNVAILKPKVFDNQVERKVDDSELLVD